MSCYFTLKKKLIEVQFLNFPMIRQHSMNVLNQHLVLIYSCLLHYSTEQSIEIFKNKEKHKIQRLHCFCVNHSTRAAKLNVISESWFKGRLSK